ncbi:MAG: rod-binding protein [Paracoccaceae bacterium]
MHLPIIPDPASTLSPARKAVLMDKARALEAGFLSEMLSHAGLDAQDGTFSGGVGEGQFTSFLRDEQAKAMVKHGGIGLAEQLFKSLARHDHGKD